MTLTSETKLKKATDNKQNKNSEVHAAHFWADFVCCHRTTYVVKLDQNGNVIVALISTVIVSSNMENMVT